MRDDGLWCREGCRVMTGRAPVDAAHGVARKQRSRRWELGCSADDVQSLAPSRKRKPWCLKSRAVPQRGFTGQHQTQATAKCPQQIWRDGSAPPRRASRVRGVFDGAKGVRSGVQGDGGSRIMRPQVTTQRPAMPQMLS